MIRKNRITAPMRAVAGLAAAALLLAGCASRPGSEPGTTAGSTTGVTDDTILVGSHYALTGVAAPGYSTIPDGFRAYFDFVNAQGGVHGRNIEFVVKDDAYVPSNSTTVVSELVQQDEVFAIIGGMGTSTHQAVVDMLNEDGVPDIFPASGALEWGEHPDEFPSSFGWMPDYIVEGKVIGTWIAEEHPDKKIGVLVQDDDSGKLGLEGISQFVGEQIVDTQKFSPSNTDIGPQMAALHASGADMIITLATPSFVALSKLQAMKLNWDPVWLTSGVGGDAEMVSSLLEKFSEGSVTGANLTDGTVTFNYVPRNLATEDPWSDLWQRVWTEAGNEGKPTAFHTFGMSMAYSFVQAALAAGPDLTREGLVEAIQTEGSAWAGPMFAPMRWSKETHLGAAGGLMVEIRDGKNVPISDVYVTDLGDAPVEVDNTHLEDAPPASGVPEV